MRNDKKTVIMIAGAAVILFVTWFTEGSESFSWVFAGLGVLYFLYGFVTINLMEEEIDGKDYRIAELEQKVKQLEEHLKKEADNNGN